MTIIRERLEEAMASKKTDIKNFIWKGEKKEVNGVMMQEEIRLIDADEKQLKKFYNHCMSMLYNQDKQNPGRYLLLDIIKDQIARCNCELFLRWLEQEKGKPRFTFLSDVRTILDNNKDSIPDTNNIPISTIVGGCPDEFKDIPISLIIDGCIDRLGYFNKQHITLSFILKQGLWFTQQELKDLTEKNEDGTTRDRVEVVKERLGLTKPDINIYITPKGLSFAQLKAMTSLRSKKYSELTTDQLKTLRNIILFALSDEVRFHISQWEARVSQLDEVAKFKGITLGK
ncbi:hypothetical protein [Intestinibacter sp.]|uniref:hypothetical protein n=1 Tax=Intestinibacter sp. TaxID=1965304 RepID=UPI003F13F76C